MGYHFLCPVWLEERVREEREKRGGRREPWEAGRSTGAQAMRRSMSYGRMSWGVDRAYASGPLRAYAAKGNPRGGCVLRTYSVLGRQQAPYLAHEGQT